MNYWGLQVRHRLSLASAGLIAPSPCTQLFLARPSTTSKLPSLGLCTFILRLEQFCRHPRSPQACAPRRLREGMCLSSPFAFLPSLCPCCVDGVFQRCRSNLFHPMFFLPPLESGAPVTALTNRIQQKGC